jgi:hypothetical protein
MFSFGPILFIVAIFNGLDEIVKYIISNIISYICKLFPITHIISGSEEVGSNSTQVPNLDENNSTYAFKPSDDLGGESESESDLDESLELFIPGRRASDYNYNPPSPSREEVHIRILELFQGGPEEREALNRSLRKIRESHIDDEDDGLSQRER